MTGHRCCEQRESYQPCHLPQALCWWSTIASYFTDNRGFTTPRIRLTPPASSSSSCSRDTTESAHLATPLTATSSFVGSLDPGFLARLDTHSTEHGDITSKLDNVSQDLHTMIGSLSALMTRDPNTVPKALDDRLNSLHLDVKGMENALTLSNLAASRSTVGSPDEESPDQIQKMHEKLDHIAHLCGEVLARYNASLPAIKAATGVNTAGDVVESKVDKLGVDDVKPIGSGVTEKVGKSEDAAAIKPSALVCLTDYFRGVS